MKFLTDKNPGIKSNKACSHRDMPVNVLFVHFALAQKLSDTETGADVMRQVRGLTVVYCLEKKSKERH